MARPSSRSSCASSCRCCSPVTAVIAMLTTIWTFNNFVYVWLATRGGPGDYTQVLATQMYTTSFVDYRMGEGAAMGVLMSLIMFVFALVYFFLIFRDRRREAMTRLSATSRRMRFAKDLIIRSSGSACLLILCVPVPLGGADLVPPGLGNLHPDVPADHHVHARELLHAARKLAVPDLPQEQLPRLHRLRLSRP